MLFLYESKYHVVSLDYAIDLVQNSKTIDCNYVVLTFDDGCESFYNIAFPVLDSFGFNATVYPITGFLGQKAIINSKIYNHLKVMSNKMINELSAKGINFGAHTVNHFRLTELSNSEAEDQINNSKFHLEDILGKQIDSFSYPHGDYNEQIIDILKNSGFSNALTCKSGFAQGAQSIFEIPRKYITYLDNIESFIQKLN
jgi:peptidoglycan/xylan/chitin deacetylase (PgdA/CDA1 family)